MRWNRRWRIRAIGYGLGAALGGAALFFAIQAGYLALLRVTEPVFAALIAANALLVVALVVIAVTLWVTRRRPHRRRCRASDDERLARIERLIEEQADPRVADLARRYPWSLTTVTLGIGVAAGYSPTIQRLLEDAYRTYRDLQEDGRPPDGE